MSQTKAAPWRDPVQLYCLRAYRRWLLIVGVLLAALIAAACWYGYLA